MVPQTTTRYAVVSWTVGDIEEYAKENEIKITRSEARHLLVSQEKLLAEAMVRAGWDILTYELDDLPRRRGKLGQSRKRLAARS